MKVALQTFDVVPRAEGGLCDSDCYGNHYQRVELEPKGKEYVVPFDALKQHDFGARVAFDPSRLRSFLITVDAVDTPFDFWVDDVSFIEHATAPHHAPRTTHHALKLPVAQSSTLTIYQHPDRRT